MEKDWIDLIKEEVLKGCKTKVEIKNAEEIAKKIKTREKESRQ